MYLYSVRHRHKAWKVLYDEPLYKELFDDYKIEIDVTATVNFGSELYDVEIFGGYKDCEPKAFEFHFDDNEEPNGQDPFAEDNKVMKLYTKYFMMNCFRDLHMSMCDEDYNATKACMEMHSTNGDISSIDVMKSDNLMLPNIRMYGYKFDKNNPVIRFIYHSNVDVKIHYTDVLDIDFHSVLRDIIEKRERYLKRAEERTQHMTEYNKSFVCGPSPYETLRRNTEITLVYGKYDLTNNIDLDSIRDMFKKSNIHLIGIDEIKKS